MANHREIDGRIMESIVNMQRGRWEVPADLAGLAVGCLEELKEKFPPDETFSEVILNEHAGYGFDIYSRPYRGIEKDGKPDLFLARDVAYCCPECKKIILAPPIIKIVGTISVLSGRRAIEYYCGKCTNMIGENRVSSS